MIDFEKLDKHKIYLGLQYGKSLISKEIRKFSKCYAPNSKDIPTHVFAIVYRLDNWWIYESHLKGHSDYGVPSGVRRYKLDVWLQIEKKSQEEFVAVPLDMDFKLLEHYIGFGYGVGDIKSLFKAAIFHTNGKQKDRKGYICSEYLALCAPYVAEAYKLPAYCITPAHFQDYAENHHLFDKGDELVITQKRSRKKTSQSDSALVSK